MQRACYLCYLPGSLSRSLGIHPLSQAALLRFYSVIFSLVLISMPVVFAGALLHFLQAQSVRDAVLLQFRIEKKHEIPKRCIKLREDALSSSPADPRCDLWFWLVKNGSIFFRYLTSAASPFRDRASLVPVRVCFWAGRWKRTDGSRRSAAVTTSPHRSVSCNIITGKTQPALLPITGEPSWVRGGERCPGSFSPGCWNHRTSALLPSSVCLGESEQPIWWPVTPRQKEETSCSFLGNQRNKRIDVYRSVQPDPCVGTSRRCICTGRPGVDRGCCGTTALAPAWSRFSFLNYKHVSEASNDVPACTPPQRRR